MGRTKRNEGTVKAREINSSAQGRRNLRRESTNEIYKENELNNKDGEQCNEVMKKSISKSDERTNIKDD